MAEYHNCSSQPEFGCGNGILFSCVDADLPSAFEMKISINTMPIFLNREKNVILNLLWGF